MNEYAMLIESINLFFASPNWQKLQSIFGECCFSILAKVAMAWPGLCEAGQLVPL